MPGLLGRAPSHDVDGVVTRVGPWTGPGKVSGLVLSLEGHAKPYVILRDDQVCSYPAGLTQPGDRVSMRVRPASEFYAVQLSAFRNQSLEEAMPHLANGLPPIDAHGTTPRAHPVSPADETHMQPVQTVRHLRLVRQHSGSQQQPIK
jgi:hypothetical protein